MKVFLHDRWGVFLKDIDLKPHQYKGWLNSKEKIENPEEFEQQVANVCEIYKTATELSQKGTIVYSVDEKTGIQAIEHKSESKPMKSGMIEKCEQEYKRKGTSGLIASRDIVTGKIIAPLIQPTRTEIDFVNHIKNVVEENPQAKHIFVMDQLNTHKSEKLVKFVAKQCNIDEKILGEKGESGILESMKTRAQFLTDEEHQIQIVYTPKHCSWLNQIEIWFSIISRRLLNKRASFKSVEDLEKRIKAFIDYYNKHLAKPFKWTYAGKVLCK